MVKSPSGSFAGWQFSEWFKGNWSTIKELIKVGLPALVSFTMVTNPALAGLLTIVGKFVLDAGQYYFTNYTK